MIDAEGRSPAPDSAGPGADSGGGLNADSGADLASELVAALVAAGDQTDAAAKRRYFRTEPGGYGEGDEFLGVRVPVIRALARQARRRATLADVEKLLPDRWHEVRSLGGILLVELFRLQDAAGRTAAVELLLANTRWLNNWDLVDSVAPYTLGPWLLEHPERRGLLDELVASPTLWERRIAVVATLGLIRAGEYDDLLRLAAKELTDPEDLMHKATGWMLREVGSRDRAALNGFLDLHARRMPRTMLRYALEKHPPDERRRYMVRP